MSGTFETTTYSFIAASIILVFAATFLFPSNLLRWLRLKKYQYDVTLALYMLTPIERVIFNSFLFLFLSMIIIATSLYLPEHISTIARRAFYYYAGDETNGQASTIHLGTVTRTVTSALRGATTAIGDAGKIRPNGAAYMEQ